MRCVHVLLKCVDLTSLYIYMCQILESTNMCSLYHNKYWSAENDLRSKSYIHANCMIIQYITVFICPTVNNVF